MLLFIHYWVSFADNVMMSPRRISLMAFLRWRIPFLVVLNLALVATTTTAPSSKLRLYMVRSPETTVAPLGDEVLFECALNVEPERLEWRFRPQGGKNELMYLNETAGYNITFKDGVSKLRIYVSPKTIGEYQCIAWYGALALASVSAKLTLATISLGNDNSKGFSLVLRGFKYLIPNLLNIFRYFRTRWIWCKYS